MPKGKTHYSATEVAQKLNVSDRTISRHIKAGKLSAARPGKSYVISRRSLTAYLGSEDLVNELFGPEEE